MIDKTQKNKDLSKLKDEILNLKKSIVNFNFQKSTGQLEKTHQIKSAKKKIARLKMEFSNKIGNKNA